MTITLVENCVPQGAPVLYDRETHVLSTATIGIPDTVPAHARPANIFNFSSNFEWFFVWHELTQGQQTTKSSAACMSVLLKSPYCMIVATAMDLYSCMS